MSGVSSYVLSIAGVVLLDVLIHLVMPEGSMSKYIQNIFALIIVFVIVSPVPGLLNSQFDASRILQTAQYEIDHNFVYLVNNQTVRQLEFNCEKYLEEEGYSKVRVSILANIFESPLNLQKVTIDLQNLVMKPQVQHINKYSKIKEIVVKTLGVKEEQIVFYG